MAYADLREFISKLEEEEELHRITTEVDWSEEAGAASRYTMDIGGPALLFENIKDYPEGHRILGSLMGPSAHTRHARIALAMGLPKDTPPLKLVHAFDERISNPIDPVVVDSAPCKEVIMKGDDIDLFKLPAPFIHTYDGGRYMGTWNIVITKDLDTGWVNWGTYRSMIQNKNTMNVLFFKADQHGGSVFYPKHDSQNKPMEVAIAIGTEPVCTILGLTPLPYGVDESRAAGGVRQEPVPVVKCETVDLEAPASAEIIIEGYMVPGERADEGPFGEYIGHFCHRGPAPVMKVTAVTYRKDPIVTIASIGKPWDDSATPASITFSAAIKKVLRDNGIQIKDAYLPAPSTGLIISTSDRPGHFQKIMATLQAGWRNCVQYTIFVDEDIDITDFEDVFWAITTRAHPKNGFSYVEHVGVIPLTPYLTPEDRAAGDGPIGIINATIPHSWDQEYRDTHLRMADFKHGWSKEMQEKILQRWKSDYGLP